MQVCRGCYTAIMQEKDSTEQQSDFSSTSEVSEIQGHTSNNRNLIISIGYLCEQDLELTPPILSDRANLCERGHPKINQFHTKSPFFFGKNIKSICNCL